MINIMLTDEGKLFLEVFNSALSQGKTREEANREASAAIGLASED